MVPPEPVQVNEKLLELRDKDNKRYQGKGVLRAVSNVKEKITPALVGLEVHNQSLIDETMIQLDGTPLKRLWSKCDIICFPCCRSCIRKFKSPTFV